MKKTKRMMYVLAFVAVVWVPNSAASQQNPSSGFGSGISDAVIALAEKSNPHTTDLVTGTHQSLRADSLLTLCEADESGCVGYVRGVVETMVSVREQGPRFLSKQGADLLRLCVPTDVAQNALAAVVRAYIRAHPQFQSSSAVSVVALAVTDAYRCQRGTR